MDIGQRSALLARLVDLEVLAGRAMCLPLVADDELLWVISWKGGGGQRIFAVGGANYSRANVAKLGKRWKERYAAEGLLPNMGFFAVDKMSKSLGFAMASSRTSRPASRRRKLELFLCPWHGMGNLICRLPMFAPCWLMTQAGATLPDRHV